MEKYIPKQVKITITSSEFTTCCFSLSEIYAIQNAAKTLLEMALAGKIKITGVGICYQIHIESGFKIDDVRIMRLVGQIATRWPLSRYPGMYSVYPVPRFDEGGSLWKGKALEYRISLLRYIIKRLKDTIRRAEKNGKAAIY